MIFQHWKYWKAICLKVNNFYLKNRTYIQLFITLISIYTVYNIVTSSADSIESSDINNDISETKFVSEISLFISLLSIESAELVTML